MADDTAKPTSETSLPSVESPSISPVETVAATPETSTDTTALAAGTAEALRAPFWADWFTPRLAVLAVSVVLAGALGGVFGALATGAKPRDVAAEHERQAMQKSLARLTKDVAGLKSELAAADRTAKAQTARVAELDKRLSDRPARDETIVTGSIAAPATAPAAATAAPAPAPLARAPLPPSRPAVQHAAASEGIASGWTVLGMHRGFVYVQSGRDVYRVAPGARLPGLGIVEEIRREGRDWVVLTRHGTIVASRDRY